MGRGAVTAPDRTGGGYVGTGRAQGPPLQTPSDRVGAGTRPAQAPRSATRLFGREEYILGLLLRAPHTLARVQKLLTDQGMTPLGEADFSQADNQALLASLLGKPLADGVLDAHLAFIEQGMARSPVLQDDAVEREALITLLRLREGQRKQELTQLEYLQADANSDGDEASVSRYAVRVQHVSLDLERIQRALTQTLRNPVPTR